MRKPAHLAAFVTAAMLLPNTATAESFPVVGGDYTTEAASVEYIMVEPVFIDETAATYTDDGSSYPVTQDVTVVNEDSYILQYEAFEPTYVEPGAEASYGATTMTETIDGVVYETVIVEDVPFNESGSVSQTY